VSAGALEADRLQGMVSAVMLGAGNRGSDVYGELALKGAGLRFVAVADRNPAKLERFGAMHGIPASAQFLDWRDAVAFAQTQQLESAFVCLPDALHEDASIACLEADLHVMLEKPAANTLAGTRRVLRAAQTSSRAVMLGYVLRFTPFFQTLRRVIQSGTLGQVVTLDWRENVSSMHYAHSYVRGNWRNTTESSPMILAKCSHDLDLLGWLTGLPVTRASSFGGLRHFTSENAPEGAPKRCLEGCPVSESCAFYAPKVYLTGDAGWPASVISPDSGLDARRAALETGPYGRCVYHCDNDVVDHQVAILELQSGASATFAMHGHSGEEGRTFRIDGTLASLRGVFSATKQELRLEKHDVATASSGVGELIPIEAAPGMSGAGHGGGDAGLMRAFVQAVQRNTRADPAQYLTSHLLAFALEDSRLNGGRVVDLERFRADG
jgi:predicted dehydrogenase